MIKETRLADVKFEVTEGRMTLEGYAIVFNQETLIGDEAYGFVEEIDHRALENTLMKDVPMKYNHMDSFLIIARTKNKSLTLSVDNNGLKVHAELLDTQSNQDIYKMVRSGLLDKMSFAFTVEEQSWNKEGKIPKRTITKIGRLYDVSVVDTPAYDSTSIYARSLESMDVELKAMELAEQRERVEVMKKKIRIKTNY
ncbi:MAG: HK97 family phage prohead protease [Candidatus Izemoplasmatales bacterium]|nr:HK97 family phage prohead protease [Candidatus Izemoplasmatales bacterium]